MTSINTEHSFFTQLSAAEWVTGIVGLTLAYMSFSAFYNIYLHPLASYPGPKFAAITRLWYVYYCIRGDLIYIVSDEHKKHGPVVRIAPDELSYTDPDSWNDIYGHRNGKAEVMKDEIFYSSQSSGAGSIINANRERHGHLRKQMSHGFSEKALRGQEPAIRKYGDLFIQRLCSLAREGKETVDIVTWFNFFTFDVMGDLVFGQSFDCLENSGYHPWVELIFDSVKAGAWVRCAKYWPTLAPFARLLIPADLQNRRAKQRAMAKEKGEFRKAIKDGRTDLISGLLKPGSGVSSQEYQSTVETLIIAGSETTATLMSGVTFYLLTSPEKMEKVVHEIRSTFSSAEELNFVSVNRLPYLLACLNEALRVYPPVADGIPRNTGPREEFICGKMVPPRTIIRSSMWAGFHSPDNFTRPDEFIPERWLGDAKEFEHDRKEALQPFSIGPRNCLGRNLAFVEMRLLMALLLWSFDLELDPTSENWSKQSAFVLWEKPPMYVKISPKEVD